MSVAERMQALLALVEQDRHAQCTAIVADARAQADALLAQARRESRAAAHEALAEERARAKAAIAAARAELHTRQRLHRQRQVESLLALAWQRLPETLRARWRDSTSRAAWIELALARARSTLPRSEWQIAFGPNGPEDERQRLAQQLGTAPRFTLDERIDAGLRIAAAGNVIDATLAGLLADRDEIGGRLIAELDA